MDLVLRTENRTVGDWIISLLAQWVLERPLHTDSLGKRQLSPVRDNLSPQSSFREWRTL